MGSSLSTQDLREFLDEKYDLYNRNSFIETDPISIPHQFSKKEDIEIAGFLAASLAWGQRKTIIQKSNLLIDLMDRTPYDFVLHAEDRDLLQFEKFVHRTFQGEDAVTFVRALQHIYQNHGGLESVFSARQGAYEAINHFREVFLGPPHPKRSEKHLSSPAKGSSSKRLNMYLRWMVRNDKRGVDFGIWPSFDTAELMLPLDVHTGNVGRKLGLLQRKANDWKAVAEITDNLRKLDAKDPVKYDFALFGLGAFEGF
ncbi:TIGR02757 family protein [bacterium SCSIO 12741]|nr:TIGR02757 family protein [bacterium SCSIO 12741]